MHLLILVALLGLIPPLQNLEASLATAGADAKPLVVYVSRSDCTFCRAFEADVLAPLIKSKVFADKAQFRELMMDKDHDASRLAQRLDVHVTPTLIFLDGDGCEVSRRILGYNRNEFFGYYLEKAVTQAIERTRSHGHLQPGRVNILERKAPTNR